MNISAARRPAASGPGKRNHQQAATTSIHTAGLKIFEKAGNQTRQNTQPMTNPLISLPYLNLITSIGITNLFRINACNNYGNNEQ